MSTNEKMPAAIATGLAKAQARVKRVGKDGTNAFHKYKYTSAEALIEAAVDLMGEQGIALVQCGWDRIQRPEDPARISVRYILTHASGESWEMPPSSTPVIPEKGRPWDKAEAAALTYSLGYTLRGLLKIPRADADDDVDQRNDSEERTERAVSVPHVDQVLASFAATVTEEDHRIAREMMESAWPHVMDQGDRTKMHEASRASRARTAKKESK